MPTKNFMTYAVTFVANTNQLVLGLGVARRAVRDFRSDAMRIGAALSATLAPVSIMLRQQIEKVAVEYDKALTESLAVMENVTPKMRKEVADATRAIALETTTTAKTAAEGFKHLALSGLDVAASLKALPIVNQFAIAGLMDMQDATELLIDSQAALGRTLRSNAVANAAELEYLADRFAKAATISNASIEQFSIALTSKAGAAMKFFSVSTEEGLAVLSAYAEQGVKAQLAGNAYDRALRLLSKSAISNARQQQMLGFSVFDSAGKMRNMADIIKNLETILRGLTDEQKAAVLTMVGFEAKSQQVITPLLGMSDAIRKYEEQLKNASGYTKSVAEKNMESLSATIQKMKNTIVELGLQIADTLIPGIRLTNSVLLTMTKIVVNLGEGWKIFFGLVISTGISIGPLLLTLGTLASSTRLLRIAFRQGTIGATTFAVALRALRLAAIGVQAVFVAMVGAVAVKAILDWTFQTEQTKKVVDSLRDSLEKLRKESQLKMNQQFMDVAKLPTLPAQSDALLKQEEEITKKIREQEESRKRIAQAAKMVHGGMFSIFGTKIGTAEERKQMFALAERAKDAKEQIAALNAQLEMTRKRRKEVGDEILKAGGVNPNNAIQNMLLNVPDSQAADKGFQMAENLKQYIQELKKIPTLWEAGMKAQEEAGKLWKKLTDSVSKENIRVYKEALKNAIDTEKEKIKSLEDKKTEALRREKDELRKHKDKIDDIMKYKRDDDKNAIASRGEVLTAMFSRFTTMPEPPEFTGPGSSKEIEKEIEISKAALSTAENTKKIYDEQVKQRAASEKIGSYMLGFLQNLALGGEAKTANVAGANP